MLDAVLTLVDAMHVTQHLDEEKPDGVVNEAGEWPGAGDGSKHTTFCFHHLRLVC